VEFSGPSAQPYRVLATTNLTLPLNSWTVVTNGTFGTAPVTNMDSSATSLLQRFYRIVSP
jgi:hypothetical protein